MPLILHATLVLSLMKILLSISSLSKSCYSHIRELRCIRPYLDTKTANTIAASIVHCNSLYFNLPKSQINRPHSSRFRTVLHVLWLKLLNLFISHPSSDLCTGLRLMNTLNINSSITHRTQFLQPANLTTYTILSLFSLQVDLAPRLLSP